MDEEEGVWKAVGTQLEHLNRALQVALCSLTGQGGARHEGEAEESELSYGREERCVYLAPELCGRITVVWGEEL